MDPPEYLQTISSQARRLHRGNKGAGMLSADAAAKDLQVQLTQTLRSTRRRSVKRRSSGASPENRLSSIVDNSSRLEELEKIEKLQSEFRLFRSEVKTKFGMLAQTMEKIEKMLVESASLSKSKKSKKKKSSSKEKESD